MHHCALCVDCPNPFYPRAFCEGVGRAFSRRGSKGLLFEAVKRWVEMGGRGWTFYGEGKSQHDLTEETIRNMLAEFAG